MELIPDTSPYRTTVEAASNNFEFLGANVNQPNRVIYGFTPGGGACYDPVTDTVFMGAEVTASENLSELATYEHENVHYEQFRRIFGEISEDFHKYVETIENQALETALDHFDDSNFIDALSYDQHLNFHNFRTMMALATEYEPFINELYDLKNSAEERIDFIDEGNPGLDEDPEMISYRAAAQTAEEMAENYWSQILEERSVEQFSPLIERYDVDVERDDLIEAQAQFWSLFRVGMLEEIPETGEPLPSEITNAIEDLGDYYTHKKFYNNGENVEQATRDLVEKFRDRKHDEAAPDPKIAVEMLNDGLERWNQKEQSKALAD